MATRSLTPPPLHGPTAKEKKYDRQLRLWAASGQQALEEAHVLLLNSGSGVVGVETLKNLILPGVGHFTIVDEKVVSEADLGINFYLTEDSLGKPRAHETCGYLTELNPDVNGQPVHLSIGEFLNAPDALEPFNLILLVGPYDLDPRQLSTILQDISKRAVPLFYVHSIGFYSQFSVHLPEVFPIVDTHPDQATTQDLRLLEPWTELIEFEKLKTKNLNHLSDHEHGHVPYLILLLHFLEDWKSSHDGIPPNDYREKKEFKSFVEGQARKDNAEGGEENFDEAASAILKSLNKSSLPSGLRDIFQELEARPLEKATENFWLVASGIQKFYDDHKALPLSGSLPDMKAQSKDYIALQNIYKGKARQDVEEVARHVRATELKLQKEVRVDSKEIEAFCKGAAFVKLIKGRPILFTTDHLSPERAKPIYEELQNEESMLTVLLAFMAYDSSLSTLASSQIESPTREPAEILNVLEASAQALISRLAFLAEDDNEEQRNELMTRVRPLLQELSRADGVELHNVSALTGGMVAQEIIKVLTKQYIPIDNTCVFDGIASKSASFRI